MNGGGGAFGTEWNKNEHVAYLLGAPRKLMRLHVCRVMPLVLILLFSPLGVELSVGASSRSTPPFSEIEMSLSP